MPDPLLALTTAATAELTRRITGRLFTEGQISALSKNAIGKYLAEFFPEPEDARAAKERVDEAQGHIRKANAIIAQMQQELAEQSTQLDLGAYFKETVAWFVSTFRIS
jgi:pyrroloquinoline quinone (PQQ) biosynthesis protein C